MDTMEDRTEFLNYINSRPLDVHRWSEYPEVNDPLVVDYVVL